MNPLDTKRRLARRNWARTSFYFLLVCGIAIVGRLVVGPAPQEFATALQTAAAPLGSVLTVFTTIVLGYLGASAYEAKEKK